MSLFIIINDHYPLGIINIFQVIFKVRLIAVDPSGRQPRWTWIASAGGSVSVKRPVVASMADQKRRGQWASGKGIWILWTVTLGILIDS